MARPVLELEFEKFIASKYSLKNSFVLVVIAAVHRNDLEVYSCIPGHAATHRGRSLGGVTCPLPMKVPSANNGKCGVVALHNHSSLR